MALSVAILVCPIAWVPENLSNWKFFITSFGLPTCLKISIDFPYPTKDTSFNSVDIKVISLVVTVEAAVAIFEVVITAPLTSTTVVPIGKSLDMSVIWDGYDIINHLTRTVDVY